MSKKTEEPKTFERPRLYYQRAFEGSSVYTSDRLRIIWPTGRVRWLPLRIHPNFGGSKGHPWRMPCWYMPVKCGERALKKMREYDVHRFHDLAEFVCEL